MSTQHSPGPWTVAAHTAESPDEITPGCDWTVYGADNVSVCFEGARNQHACANVRLIAAAPDLLEALQAMVDGDSEAIEQAEALGVPFPAEMLTAYIKARAAIAKALGEKI